MRLTSFDRDLTSTPEGREEMFRSIITELRNTNRHEDRDTICYNIYNGEQDPANFSYLTKIGENYLPAKIRWFPLLTSKVNKLVSQEAQRDIKSRVFLSDRRSVKEREKKRSEKLFNLARKKIELINESYLLQEAQVTVAKQRMQQLSQEQPQNEKEQRELAELQANLPMLEVKLNTIMSNIQFDKLVTDKEVDEIDRYMTYDDKDIIEEAFQGGLNDAIYKQKMKMKKVNAFRNKVVTGKEIFFVHYEKGMINPVFENLPVRNVKWTTELNAHFIQDCRASSYDTEMSITEILTRYGKHLKQDDLIGLVRYSDAVVSRSDAVVPTPDNGAIFINGNYSTSGGRSIKVTYGFWKVNRDVRYTEIPNKHNGDYFRHVVDKNYKSKKDGEQIHERFVEDMWEGVCINDKYYINIKKSDIQLRNYDVNPSFVRGPITGYAFNDPATKPYSIVWESRDLQELISVLNFQRELMFAMGGVKGIVMDMSQRPDMSDDEWLLDFKRGIAWIDSFKGGRQSSYNQFQTYDNSVSPAVGMISEIINHLEEQISITTGVTRESMGQTQKDDQVGTYEMATNASNLITFIMYYEHDVLVAEALSRYINLARYAWKDGKEGTYMTSLNAKKYFKIHKDIAVDRYIDLFLSDSTKDNQKIEMIQQVAFQARNNKEITLSQLISILDTDNLKEMEKKVSYYADKLQNIAQSNAMSVEQKKAEVEQMKIQMKGDIDMKIKQSEMQLKQAELVIKKSELEIKRAEMYIRAKLEREKMGADMQTKAAEIETETAVEMAYLDEEKTMHRIDEAIREAQLKLDALSTQGEMLLRKEEGDKSHSENMKKLDVEKTKARSQGMGKERIKD